MKGASMDEQEVIMKVYIGIDWSEQKHDICFLKDNGEVLRNLQIPHTMNGFFTFDKARQEMGVLAGECVVGMETAHNLLVDYLWELEYQQIYILPPKAVKSAQGRFRQSGARDDPWDARLIADMLRTDQKRYTQWHPDNLLTCQIRTAMRMVLHLTREMVRNSNRLRAVLIRYYPAALNLFSRLDSPVLLAFIQAYPTPQAAAAVSFEEFSNFLRSHHYNRPQGWIRSYNKLKELHPPTNLDTVATYTPQAMTLARILTVLVESKGKWLKELTCLYEQHPDRVIYSSLPAAGTFLEPALLAKLGDDRQRFPSPKVLQAVAGTCPVTQRSGKRQVVYFRWACDHEFRYIIHQWAKLSLEASPWAEAYYRSVLPHCRTSNDAIRRLANRWLEVLWRLWQDRKPYDQEYHLNRHTSRITPR
jgi:transposase